MIDGNFSEVVVDIREDQILGKIKSVLNKDDFRLSLHIGQLRLDMSLEQYEQLRAWLWEENNMHIGFSKEECKALKWMLSRMRLEDGRAAVDEFKRIWMMEVGLDKHRFNLFASKIEEIVNAGE